MPSAPRFRQRGHASVPLTFDAPRRPGLGWTTAMLLAGIAVAGTTMAFLHLRSQSTDWALPQDTAPSPSPASASPEAPPSLLQSALARFQGEDRAASAASQPDSGLVRMPLDEVRLTTLEPRLGRAEARLIRVYQAIRAGDSRQALDLAERLVRDYPNFQLAQLVLGDLLTLRTRPIRQLGDIQDIESREVAAQLESLRDESRRRILALTERPPEGHVPRQFLALAPQSRHAIAVDASRSRLYLFENLAATSGEASNPAGTPRLRLIGDYYISVGLQGIEKQAEGNQRTPLGVYYITSTLDPKKLPDLYGVGALPINYPNALDVTRGKTGSGIWLHGTPREQFVRAPQASDGCVVLSNQDLAFLLKTVRIRTTPVVIAQQLEWVDPANLEAERQGFASALETWRQARSTGDIQRLRSLYSARFRPASQDAGQWWGRVESELHRPVPVQIKDASLLKWQDSEETMVVTFGEVPVGRSRGITRRQYWIREQGQWKIFYERSA